MTDIASSLLDAVRRLNESLDPSRVLVRVCEEATRVLDASQATLFLSDPDGEVRAEATYGGPAQAIGATVGAGDGLVGRVIERDEPLMADGALAVPLRWDGRLHGALVVAHAARPGTPEQLELLEAFADLAASACRNASTHAELALSARTDALTGCLNHAAMHDALHRELERSSRHGGDDLSLVILDLDEFKQVNELHGHLAGDEVLRKVGRALRQSVRAYDFVARYGGDEFAIVAVDADEDTATEVARRAVEAVGHALAELGSAAVATAATAGVAQARDGDSPSSLIGRADGALLHGKHRGGRGTPVRASSLPD